MNNKQGQIGSVKIDGQAILAPMAGVNDIAYRLLAKKHGAALVCTEMVSAMGIKYKNERTHELLRIEEAERPVSMQIFGSNPEAIALGAKVVADSDSINVVDFAKRIESTGVAAIAVHGRTKEQMYSGHADWSYIKAVKEAVSVPVLGNGDIVKPEDAKQMLDETGCDAVMVGRGAQGNPWIFGRIHHYLATGEVLPAPTDIERLDMLLKHFDLLCQYKGESMAVKEIRTHAGWYMKGLPESAYWRNRVNTIHTVTSFHNELESYRKILSEG